MSAQPLPRATVEEYIEFDRSSEHRNEFYDGFLYAMAGGSLAHAKIITNTLVALSRDLRGRDCDVYGPDLRVRVAEHRCYTYPDVTVVFGPAEIGADQTGSLLNPTVLVEVLSKTTEAHDRGLKFARYRSLASLKEYVLIAQHEPRIEVYRRQPGDQWLLTDYYGEESVCRLESIACEIPLSAVYAKVSFDDSAPPR